MKQTPIILIALSIIVAATTIGIFYYSTLPSQTDLAVSAPVVNDQQDDETGQSEPSKTAEDATAEAGAGAGESPPTDTASGTAASEQTPDNEAKANAVVERGINLARVRPDGTAVIAGLAPPGSTVTLKIGDTVIGSSLVTKKGEWVVVPDAPLPPGSHLVTVMVTPPDGSTEIEEMALVIEIPRGDELPLVALVPYAADDAPVIVLQAPDTVAPATETDQAMADGAQTQPAQPQPQTQEQSQQQNMTMMMAPAVTIRSIQALNSGYIIVGGKAEGGAAVRLSINETEAPLMPVTDGSYHLGHHIGTEADHFMIKVTLHDDDEQMIASARLKLSRRQIETTLSSNTLVVVHKGDALWRIAYQTYGKGIRYVDIYRQNSSIIRDPDLIYPDQIFVVPNS